MNVIRAATAHGNRDWPKKITRNIKGWWKSSISSLEWWLHGCNILIKIYQIVYLKYVLSLYANYTLKFFLVESILMGGLWENLQVGNQWECCGHSLGGRSHSLNWGRVWEQRKDRAGEGTRLFDALDLGGELAGKRRHKMTPGLWLGWMASVSETETPRGVTGWEGGEMSSDVETLSLWWRCFWGYWTCGSRFQEREMGWREFGPQNMELDGSPKGNELSGKKWAEAGGERALGSTNS